MRWQRPLLIVAAVVVAIALVVIGGLFAFRDLSADAVRRVVVPRLEAITHRDVSITGDFDLVPSLTPTLTAEGLAVANAPWGSRPTMLEAERVEVELQLLPLLLRRDVVIDRLALVGAHVLLERGPGGQVNWEFDPAAPEPAERRRQFLLNEVSIEDSRATWRDVDSDRSEAVRIEQLTWQADSATDDLALSGAGEFEEHPFTLAGELGAIATLRRGEEPYPIALELTVEDLEVALEGQLSPGRAAQLDMQVTGPSVAALGDLVGRELPELGAYQDQGELAGSIDDLARSDLTGTIGTKASRSFGSPMAGSKTCWQARAFACSSPRPWRAGQARKSGVAALGIRARSRASARGPARADRPPPPARTSGAGQRTARSRAAATRRTRSPRPRAGRAA